MENDSIEQIISDLKMFHEYYDDRGFDGYAQRLETIMRGCQLVPIEPTPTMVDQARRIIPISYDALRRMWQTLLASAPK